MEGGGRIYIYFFYSSRLSWGKYLMIYFNKPIEKSNLECEDKTRLGNCTGKWKTISSLKGRWNYIRKATWNLWNTTHLYSNQVQGTFTISLHDAVTGQLRLNQRNTSLPMSGYNRKRLIHWAEPCENWITSGMFKKTTQVLLWMWL